MAKSIDEYMKEQAQSGDLEQLRLAVKRGANVGVEDNYALRWAARNGHMDVVRF